MYGSLIIMTLYLAPSKFNGLLSSCKRSCYIPTKQTTTQISRIRLVTKNVCKYCTRVLSVECVDPLLGTCAIPTKCYAGNTLGTTTL